MKHLSNLLKKRAGDTVEPFGFPLIGSGDGDPAEMEAADQYSGPVHPDPAESYEEIFRKKMLELERRGQEIEREAYAKGFMQGEKDGLEYGQKTVQVIKTQLERIAENMEEVPARVFKEYRNWFVITCLKVARRVVRGELAISPRIVARVVSSLLEEAEEHSSLTLYLHPLDIEFMEKRAGIVLEMGGKQVKIREDDNLERGGCRVESEIQLLDASIDSQFEELEKHLLKETRRDEASDAVRDGR